MNLDLAPPPVGGYVVVVGAVTVRDALPEAQVAAAINEHLFEEHVAEAARLRSTWGSVPNDVDITGSTSLFD